jgi:hypothetical protein
LNPKRVLRPEGELDATIEHPSDVGWSRIYVGY